MSAVTAHIGGGGTCGTAVTAHMRGKVKGPALTKARSAPRVPRKERSSVLKMVMVTSLDRPLRLVTAPPTMLMLRAQQMAWTTGLCHFNLWMPFLFMRFYRKLFNRRVSFSVQWLTCAGGLIWKLGMLLQVYPFFQLPNELIRHVLLSKMST